MSDELMLFLPWIDGFTRGYYLAGIETDIDAVAPNGRKNGYYLVDIIWYVKWM